MYFLFARQMPNLSRSVTRDIVYSTRTLSYSALIRYIYQKYGRRAFVICFFKVVNTLSSQIQTVVHLWKRNIDKIGNGHF